METMYYAETPEYLRLKSVYGRAIAERYKKLIASPDYRTTGANAKVHLDTREWEERRGRPSDQKK